MCAWLQIQLTTSLTLLAICNTIIDLLALYVMPDREEYRKAKFETTEDFSDLRKAKSLSQSLHQGDDPEEEELQGIRVAANGEAYFDCEEESGGESKRAAVQDGARGQSRSNHSAQ